MLNNVIYFYFLTSPYENEKLHTKTDYMVHRLMAFAFYVETFTEFKDALKSDNKNYIYGKILSF